MKGMNDENDRQMAEEQAAAIRLLTGLARAGEHDAYDGHAEPERVSRSDGSGISGRLLLPRRIHMR